MRKVYRRKKRSCGLCKPNKVGWEKRFKVKELAERRAFEKGKE